MTMDLMSWRLGNLQATIDGFAASGVPLVTRVGSAFGKADLSDDPGLYLFAGPLGAWFGLDAARAATLFFLLILSLSCLVGSAGVWKAFLTPAGRAVGTLALIALTLVAWRIGDVYMVSAATLMAPIPWLLHVRRTARPRAVLAFAAATGLFAGASNLVRSHSGTALAVVALAAFALAASIPARLRATAAAVLLAGMLIAPAGLTLVHRHREAFLSTVATIPPAAASGHPLWHSIYIGLGYVPNGHGITYRDEVAFAFVKERDPGALSGSEESESILRREVFRLAAADPAFVARNVGAKLLAIACYLLAFANIGLVSLILARPPWRELVPLLLGLAFTALPGVLVVPMPGYLLGFIAMSTLTGIYGIDAWFSKRAGRGRMVAHSEA